ncbi:glycosyltransferase [Chitinophaga sp. Cy-1792]|uniref:glycosyltransferase n=1 Tax=Chitinophaga sp. Cy-1792 TaxID=2608339 RepID=UPI0014222A3F|nr:glycosyltransferase [Chitinophaga sp. Cy-1792]NIG52087.1 glycosyltransferase [Chitinophaga sp. Cy-1792]
MRKIRVAYIVWNEDPYKNNIFNNQVADQIIQIKQLHPEEVDITLVINFPLSSFVRNKKGTKQDVIDFKNQLTASLAAHNIKLQFYFSRFAFNFNTKFYLLPFQYFENFTKVKKLVEDQKIDIVHCRSYHAGFVGASIRRLFKNVKFVFDTRGRFPEEGIFRKSYEKDSLSYKIWKKRERFIISNADAVVNVSEAFQKIFETDYPKESQGKNTTIYTSSNVQVMTQPRQNNIPVLQNTNAMVFVGELSENGGYSVKKVMEAYRIYRKVIASPHLVFISTTNRDTILKEIGDVEFKDEITITATTRFQDTYNILSQCKFGFAALNDWNAPLMEYLAPTVIAAKTGEYLTAGLPLIYDNRIGGVLPLIQNHNIGMAISYPLSEEVVASQLMALNASYDEISDNCKKFACSNFSSTNNAERYFELYRKVLGAQ